MIMLIPALLFVFLSVAIIWFGYRRFAKPGRIFEQLSASAHPGYLDNEADSRQSVLGQVVTTIQWIGEKMPASPEDASATQKELIAAGYRSDRAVAVFSGLKIVGALVLALVAFLLKGYITDNSMLGIVLVIAGAGIGYFLPSFILDVLIDRRRERLRISLPDALDLLVVCVEAGLGLDQALRVVSRELQITHRELSEELSLLSLEMRAGTKRADAFQHLASRTGENEVKKLVAVLIQTDRFGTSVAEALRTHSDFMRVRRRQEAEEKANKIGVKLIFPIFFLIMPATMIVAAGPGVLMIARQLLPMMNEISVR
jgi:tight adherence protein C